MRAAVGGAKSSHGRSHRFNPCHAHQPSSQVSTPLAPQACFSQGAGEPISQQFPSSLRRESPNHPAAAHRLSTPGVRPEGDMNPIYDFAEHRGRRPPGVLPSSR